MDQSNILDQVQADTEALAQLNTLLAAAGPAMLFAPRIGHIAGLTFAWIGGRLGALTVAHGSQALDDDEATIYMSVDRSTLAVAFATGTTAWDDPAHGRALRLATAGGAIIDWQDWRSDPDNGILAKGGSSGGSAGPLAWTTPTASYTLVLADAGGGVEMDVAGANTITVPPASSVPFAIGTSILLAQLGTGATSIVAGSGVTLHSRGALLGLASQYAVATLVKRGTDEWYLAGDLA